MTEVRAALHLASRPGNLFTIFNRVIVSRLYAHSKNYDMDLTLDYNIELFPLQSGQSFALALASSLSRAPQGPAGAEDEDKDRDVWRPDAKGRKGLDDDYEYVMYGKVSTGLSFPCHSYPRNDTRRSLRFFLHATFVCRLAHTAPKVYRFDGGSAEIV